MPKDNFGNTSRFNEGAGEKKPLKNLASFKLPETQNLESVPYKKSKVIEDITPTPLKIGKDVPSPNSVPEKLGKDVQSSLPISEKQGKDVNPLSPISLATFIAAVVVAISF